MIKMSKRPSKVIEWLSKKTQKAGDQVPERGAHEDMELADVVCDEVEVPLVDGESSSGPAGPGTELFLQYTNPQNSKWIGFRRSKTADNHRRHRAKCESCQAEMPGILLTLRNHKSVCLMMPDEVRKQV